ncbi:cell division protein FtsA [uncultured Sphingomonas sp.]|uniref:cell division protein FtsA n=1 Tax=uncultured Sphingomonas sp. TaxID=158754 RepID=UPI0025E39E4E|nr:cell division protein FtsA [uncultured Sphingomonas sp.]
MAQPRSEGLITAVDIGSSKVAALIVQPTEGGLQVLGSGQRESRGVKHGYITDMQRTEQAVREAVEQAETIARTNIDEVFVSFSAGGLYSDVASVEVGLGGQRIAQGDIDELLDAGRNSIEPDGRMVLHAQPTLYTLDGLKGVRQPLGLHAETLGVDIHVVSGDPSPIRNLDHCIRSAHLGVKSVVASPIATAMACLSEEERELGVALVELGAGVTNVSLFAGGLLVGLASLPMGSGEITDDIASTFGLRRAQAERLKCVQGSAQTAPRDNHEMIEAAGGPDGAEQVRITRAQLIGVIRQRLDQWFAAIEEKLKELGFSGPIARRLVLTGGGAELKGIAEYAQGVLGRAVRIGRPRGLIGLPDAHAGMSFTTLAGLALYAASDPIDLRRPIEEQPVTRLSPTGMVHRLIQAVRSNY